MRGLRDFIFEAANTLQSYGDVSKNTFNIDKLKKMLDEVKEVDNVDLLPVASALITALYEPLFPVWVKNSWYKGSSITSKEDDKLIEMIWSALRKKPMNNNCLKELVSKGQGWDIIYNNIPQFDSKQGKGNIINQIKTSSSDISKLSESFIQELSNITIQKKGVAVGKWEIVLQTLFNNIFRPTNDSSGDCVLDSLPLEVKGSEARLHSINQGQEGIKSILKVLSKEGVDIKSLQVFEDENFLVGKFTEQVDILKKVEDLPALIVLFFNSIFECGCVKKDVDKLSKLIIEGDQSKIQSEYNLMLASCNLYNYKNKFSKIIFINNTSSDYMLLDSSSLNTISNVKKQLSKDFKIFGNLTTKKVSGVGRDKYSPQITYLG